MFSQAVCLIFALALTSAATINANDNNAVGPISRAFVRLGNSKYYFVVFPANWYHAFQTCASGGMQLVSIHGHEDQVAIETQVRINGYEGREFWTSGNRLADRYAGFVWMSTGKKVAYNNWHYNYPTYINSGEDCLALTQFSSFNLQWKNSACSNLKNFICEAR